MSEIMDQLIEDSINKSRELKKTLLATVVVARSG